MTGIPNLDRACQKARVWLKELDAQGHFDDQQLAWAALRSVLQTLRDRLTPEEAAHLGAQLPLVIRGVYYENYRPSDVPTDHETRQEFLDAVRERLYDVRGVNAERAVESVFALLREHVTEGEIDQVRGQLPEEIAALWTAAA